MALDEATAQKVVEQCAAEAKIVAVEQEAKKIADASAKAAVAASQRCRQSGPARLLATRAAPAEEKMPGALESAAGGAPEVIVHADTITAGEGEELSRRGTGDPRHRRNRRCRRRKALHRWMKKMMRRQHWPKDAKRLPSEDPNKL